METTNSLLPIQRRQKLLEIIKENYTAKCSQLSEMLNVSEMTIRRDLMELEKQGKIERTHGGAVFHHERATTKFLYSSSKGVNPEEKKKIAAKAVGLVNAHETIFIGEGTTPSLILNYADPNLPFTVFTNNYGIAAELNNRELAAELIFLGGTYNPETCSTSGNYPLEMIERINADKVFLGADAFSLRGGLCTRNADFAAIDRAMIRNTRGEVIILSDHSKFGLIASLEIAKPKEIDIIVTNTKLSQQFYEDLASFNISVIDASI